MKKHLILAVFNLIASMTLFGQDVEEKNPGAEVLKFLRLANDPSHQKNSYVSPNQEQPESYQNGAAPTGHPAPESYHKKKQQGCFPFSLLLKCFGKND
ncbi:hypothetical protein HOM50_02810 [bacterium]|jgi:hypothetical protein|nr:hypothetical protein [bacterium]MBT5015309.1 hypothetical protein [bacterium]